MRRYYEFGISVILIGILATLLLSALSDIQGEMEEAGVQAEAAAIRTQLLETLAHREVFGGRLPESNNPMDWVSNRPPNYLGSVESVPLKTGVWYFDQQAGELIYCFRDGHLARFRLSRNAGNGGGHSVLAGVGLLRIGK